MGMRSRKAVSISCEFIKNAPSPTAASTLRPGPASLAAMAPGKAKAMVDSPLDSRQVLGSYVGYRRAIHIFTAPVSARTISERSRAARISDTIRWGRSGKLSSAAPRGGQRRADRRAARARLEPAGGGGRQGVQGAADVGLDADLDVVVGVHL